MAAWLILHHCVLLDAVCDPGSGGSRSSCKSPVPVQGLRCPAVSPLSGECPHRAAHQLNPSLAATASVACVTSHCFGHSKCTFEATYRIQLLSLHLATFPPPATLAAGFGYGRLTILTRRASHPLDGEPYPGSRLIWFAPSALFVRMRTVICTVSGGPKARSITAWGNAPGMEAATRLRAEGPIHSD